LLAAACRNVDLLDSDQQRRLVEKLATWLSVQPGQASLLAGDIATIEGLAATPAKDLVDGLIAAERAAEGMDARQQLLAAAYAIRGQSRSRARSALKRRLEEMEQGSDAERELAEKYAG
jgi:hypothetical protein